MLSAMPKKDEVRVEEPPAPATRVRRAGPVHRARAVVRIVRSAPRRFWDAFNRFVDFRVRSEEALRLDLDEAARKQRQTPSRTLFERLSRDRQIKRLILIGTRLGGLSALLFPLFFSVGWLYQAGFLFGSGVNLALVAPDPGSVAV